MSVCVAHQDLLSRPVRPIAVRSYLAKSLILPRLFPSKDLRPCMGVFDAAIEVQKPQVDSFVGDIPRERM